MCTFPACFEMPVIFNCMFTFANRTEAIDEHSCITQIPYTNSFLGPILLNGLTSTPAWICNYIDYKVWDEITYPSLGMGK